MRRSEPAVSRAPLPSSPPKPGERVSPGSHPEGPSAQGWRARLRSRLAKHGQVSAFFAGIVLALAIVLIRDALAPPQTQLTQEDIDAAVLHTLETRDLPSRAARAAEAVRQSVVRIRGYAIDPSEPEAGLKERGTGTGVVIMEDGTLLTNLHVVAGAEELRVTFFDGSETTATLAGAQPDNDLAVLKPKEIPDDLPPATLGASNRLAPGDEVVAVGFPFGIGPSVSAGVVSGLNREFKSEEGERPLKGLIQFDAAANPGNSGGPLVTLSGEVVGIVTAILNPTSARTFVGIGFAVTIESAGTAIGIPPF
jgi:S1-C subfamily serine protease